MISLYDTTPAAPTTSSPDDDVVDLGFDTEPLLIAVTSSSFDAEASVPRASSQSESDPTLAPAAVRHVNEAERQSILDEAGAEFVTTTVRANGIKSWTRCSTCQRYDVPIESRWSTPVSACF